MVEQFKAKVCMVGDAAVGKTSLVRRFVFDAFSDVYQSTLGTRVLGKEAKVSVEGKDVAVKMQVWDIIGETSLLEDFAPSYFLNVQGIIAVCDFTRYSTFERLPIWLAAVERVAGIVPKALAVNKVDLAQEVLTLYDEHRVRQFADEIGLQFYMTSAKNGENVEAMFSALATNIVADAWRRHVDESRGPPVEAQDHASP